MSRPDPAHDAWARIEAILGAAIELPPGERAAFLDEADLDGAMRVEVESLLAALDRDPTFLEAVPPWIPSPREVGSPPDAGVPPHASMPDRVGPYRVLRLLGRGGTGAVFLAAREDPGSRRRVAIKLMRSGPDAGDVLRRFGAERRILATLDHPSIARLLEVGTMDDGVPYFVMEYVVGADIVDHCRRNGLSVRERLTLFDAVCSAVHDAHQAGIVHRNLKPANIRVTEAGVPKLLDLGLAGILEAGPAERNTGRSGERLPPSRYSSPEQVRGERGTAACDVWALGVLLYEILADRHPFTGDGDRSNAEMGRLILEHDPAPPSAVAPPPLRGELAGALDTITLEALRKEPGSRYASVAALVDDVRRHLEARAVESRPATLRERIRSFLRRSRR